MKLYKKTLKVSVITVCKNAEQTIEQTIQSVLSQSYKNIEYIIIDGKSEDNTLKVINKYKKKIAYIKSEKDKGIYEAMNKGISASGGDIIIFLNATDYFYDSSVVKKIVKGFNSNKVDIVYGDSIILYPDSNKKKYKKYDKVDKTFLHNDTLPHQSTACRIELFKIYGYFDESFQIAGDYEWFLRVLFTKRVASHYVNYPFSIFRWGGISNKKSYKDIQKIECTRIVKKYFNFIENILYKEKLIRIIRKIDLLDNILRKKMRWDLPSINY